MRPARGFTLIEMMIALTLFSMMMLAIVAAMRTLGNTQSTLEQVTGRVDEIRGVSEFLRNSLSMAMPVVRLGSPGEAAGGSGGDGTYFVGDSRQVYWVAPFVAGADLGGAYVMHLARVEDRLELRWHPYDRDASAVEWGGLESRVLIDDVQAFSVGYLGGFEDDWEDEWPGYQRNPVALRLTIRARDRYWPELVIRLNGADMNLR